LCKACPHSFFPLLVFAEWENEILLFPSEGGEKGKKTGIITKNRLFCGKINGMDWTEQ